MLELAKYIDLVVQLMDLSLLQLTVIDLFPDAQLISWLVPND